MRFKSNWIIFVIGIPLITYLLIRVIINEKIIESKLKSLKLRRSSGTDFMKLATQRPTMRPTKKVITKRRRPKQSLMHPVGGCKPIGASALSKVKTTKYGIPLIMHQIYKDPMLPVQYIPLVKNCRRINPDFVHLLWTDRMMHDFIDAYYPEYENLLAQYVMVVSQADFFRILVLYHFGGVYIDLDVECKKPLSVELDQFKSGAILDQERRLQTRLLWSKDFTAMNSAMMGRRRHPFFKYMLDRFPRQLKYRHFMWRTGPFALHQAYVEYQRRNVSNHVDRVILAPDTAFSPLLDPALTNHFRMRCGRPKELMSKIMRLGCEEWIKKHKQHARSDPKMVREAILMHRFMHLVYHPMYDKHILRLYNICQRVPTLSMFVAN